MIDPGFQRHGIRQVQGSRIGIVTKAFEPLNTSALPYLPEAVQVALVVLPLLPVPEESVTVVPAPSLNEYAATNPVIVDVVVRWPHWNNYQVPGGIGGANTVAVALLAASPVLLKVVPAVVATCAKVQDAVTQLSTR